MKSYSWNSNFELNRGSVLLPDKLTLQHRDKLDMTEKKKEKVERLAKMVFDQTGLFVTDKIIKGICCIS